MLELNWLIRIPKISKHGWFKHQLEAGMPSGSVKKEDKSSLTYVRKANIIQNILFTIVDQLMGEAFNVVTALSWISNFIQPAFMFEN